VGEEHSNVVSNLGLCDVQKGLTRTDEMRIAQCVLAEEPKAKGTKVTHRVEGG